MFSNILVGVDERQGGRDAVVLAKQLASPDARLALGHVYSGNLLFRDGVALALTGGRETSEQLLTRERDQAALGAELIVYAAPSVGRGPHELAKQQGIELLVSGSWRTSRSSAQGRPAFSVSGA